MSREIRNVATITLQRTQWWHHYAGEADGLFAEITVGKAPFAPDGDRVDGDPVTHPLPAPPGLGLPAGTTLAYRGSWRHEPSDLDVAAVTPVDWHDEDCPCPREHPDEAPGVDLDWVAVP